MLRITDGIGCLWFRAQRLLFLMQDRGRECRYKSDYGMFRFCVADTEHDWRAGTEQYAFLEECMRTVDRQKQPWLIFLAHRVLGYSSGYYYALEGTFSEPWGRDDLQILWQKYKVDLAFYGHIHNYERTCPVYQVRMLTKILSRTEDKCTFFSSLLV